MELTQIIIIIGIVFGPSIIIAYLFNSSMNVLLGCITVFLSIVITEGFLPYEFVIIPALLIAYMLWNIFGRRMDDE